MQTATASGTDAKWTEEAAPVALVGVAALLVLFDEAVEWVVFDERVPLGAAVRELGAPVPEAELSGVVEAEAEADPDIAVVFPPLSLRTKLSEKTIELDGEQ
jgi:hypothetical protein